AELQKTMNTSSLAKVKKAEEEFKKAAHEKDETLSAWKKEADKLRNLILLWQNGQRSRHGSR
ncbi:hypothetical protein ACFL6F_01980, partial [Planctomycetota bacterium]